MNDAKVSRWQLSSAGYYLDFFIAPAFLLLALSQSRLSAVTVTSFLMGALAWSFAEYAIHRFVFHRIGQYKREHFIHHRRPHDYIGVPPWQTVVLFIITWSITWLLFGQNIGSATFAGFLTGYYAYIALHDGHHHRDRTDGFRRYMGRLHDVHHDRNRVNFGVSSPLWDFVFGTYQAIERH
jgi:sterol desaturase/sphingolipid hydroxylase (fatty acid hydroxylase superfamily)